MAIHTVLCLGEAFLFGMSELRVCPSVAVFMTLFPLSLGCSQPRPWTITTPQDRLLPPHPPWFLQHKLRSLVPSRSPCNPLSQHQLAPPTRPPLTPPPLGWWSQPRLLQAPHLPLQALLAQALLSHPPPCMAPQSLRQSDKKLHNHP